MTLIIYGDYMSQPTRLVVWVTRLLNLGFDFKSVCIGKKEQTKESYLKINPFGMVPAIQDGDFNLYESHAIVRYLVNKYGGNSKLELYGGNGNDVDTIKNKAKIDEYLDWHHTGLRYTFHHYFHEAYLNLKTGEPINKELLESTRNNIPIVLNDFERLFLKNGQYKYVNGFSYPTLADLSAFCEIMQLNATDFDYTKFNHLNQWMESMKQLTHYNEIFNLILNADKVKF